MAALPTDSPTVARLAGLRYTPDPRPGISRRRAGRGFYYTRPDGHKDHRFGRAQTDPQAGDSPCVRTTPMASQPFGTVTSRSKAHPFTSNSGESRALSIASACETNA